MRHLWKSIGIIGLLLLVVWVGVRVVAGIQFDRGCEGHLKRAADSNTVALAQSELSQALEYMEDNDLTTGYTSILWTTPDEDISFWYTNLMATLAETREITDQSSALERSNILMKLRETILDASSDGVKVTSPGGIAVYPLNGLFAIWGVLASALTLLGACSFVVWLEH